MSRRLWQRLQAAFRGPRTSLLRVFTLLLLVDVSVVPSRDWSDTKRIEANGQETSEVSLNDDDSQPSLLGLSLRLCNPDGALEKVCNIAFSSCHDVLAFSISSTCCEADINAETTLHSS